jgi:tetratricopeptide (TPR) repeat protein
MLKRAWIIIKLIYLHATYLLVGIDDEAFHIYKGNYFTDLNWYYRAIRNYEKALIKSKSPRLHLALGFCLLRVGRFMDSLEHFRIAYQKINQPDVALGLAIAEYETGNIERCRELVQKLNSSENQLYLTNNDALKKLKDKLNKVNSSTN